MKPHVRLAKWVWGHYDVILVLTGIVVVAASVHSLLAVDRVVADSVAVEATIQEAHVEVHELASPDEYEPHVTYEYEYSGTTYTGTTIYPNRPAPRFTDRDRAEAAADYSPGERVTAHVLPSDPETAHLTQHPGQEGYGHEIGIAVWIVFVIGGLLGFVDSDDGDDEDPQGSA